MPAGQLEPLSQAPATWRYTAAVALVWGAALLGQSFGTSLGVAPYLTVLPAVMLAALVLGTGPGVVGAAVAIFLVERAIPGELLSGGRWIRGGVALFTAVLVGRIAQKARTAHGQLERADRRKNEFLGMLSHELRNPLAAMRNALDILDGSKADPARLERSRRIVERQVQHLSLLVDDLLDVTRVSRGKIQLQRCRLDLRELVARCVEDQRGIAREHGLSLKLRSGTESVPVDADPTRLSQVVGNLLANSIKFGNSGGRIDVGVERGGMGGLVRVRDDGIGIPRELLDQVFEPFTQADESLDRTRGGLGLGLALAKGLVDLHGGRIEARSGGPGRGTEMTISLPLSALPARAALAPSLPATRRGTRKILIVEDNADAADPLREILQLRGHRVEVARNGEEGIAMARAFRPEIVLCDIGLPGIDGYGVARAIRSDPSLAGTYLVALTGYARPDDRQRAHEAGFDRHVAKPVTPAEVDDAISSAGSPEAA